MRIRQIRTVIALIMVTLLLAACQDHDLQTLAKALDDSAHGVAVLQTVVIEANNQHLMSDDVTRSLLEFSVKVNLAGQNAVMITRNINSLDAADRQRLLNILAPVVDALRTGQVLTNSITDVNARQRVVAALALVQVALNSAQLVLASR